MSNQVELIRAGLAKLENENNCGTDDFIEAKRIAFQQVREVIDALPAKENPILVPKSQEAPIEVAGKKVVVRYARTQEDACASCAFCARKECHDLDCNMRDIIGEGVCKYAYFIETEQQQEPDYKKLYEDIVNSEWYKKNYRGKSVGEVVEVEQPNKTNALFEICVKNCDPKVRAEVRSNIDKIIAEEIHSLREWAQILAANPDLRAEFDKMCPPQPIQGSIAPEADVNKHAVKHAFLHCDKAGKIVSEMYGDKINNSRNIDKYLAFLKQVELDDRFGELAEILQRYGAMPAPKQQPESDLEAEIERYESVNYGFEGSSRADCLNIARHFAEWERGRIENAIRLAWVKISMNPFDVDSVFNELLEHLKK